MGQKGSATGEASQSTNPWGLYGGEANRDANSNKARRESGDCLERQAKTTRAFCKVRFCFLKRTGAWDADQDTACTAMNGSSAAQNLCVVG